MSDYEHVVMTKDLHKKVKIKVAVNDEYKNIIDFIEKAVVKELSLTD